MTEADREKVGWIRNGLVYACAEDLCRIIRELEAERDALRARCERMEKALRDVSENLLKLRPQAALAIADAALKEAKP